MTLTELNQKLAVEKLVETGIGFVSEKTYDDIVELLAERAEVRDLNFNGIRLIKNPFIPDGEIYPFQPWDLRPKTPTHFER